MSDLTFDEQCNLLLARWERIDMPARFRRCWRIRPYRWLATAGILRHRERSGARRTVIGRYVGWTITAAWIQVWWYRRV